MTRQPLDCEKEFGLKVKPINPNQKKQSAMKMRAIAKIRREKIKSSHAEKAP